MQGDGKETGEVANMNTQPIEYIESFDGRKLNKNDLGCKKFSNCFECTLEKCIYEVKEEKSEKRRQQVNAAGKRYREKNKDKQRERLRIWREKQRLAKLLDQKRQDAEEKAITPLIP